RRNLRPTNTRDREAPPRAWGSLLDEPSGIEVVAEPHGRIWRVSCGDSQYAFRAALPVHLEVDAMLADRHPQARGGRVSRGSVVDVDLSERKRIHAEASRLLQRRGDGMQRSRSLHGRGPH